MYDRMAVLIIIIFKLWCSFKLYWLNILIIILIYNAKIIIRLRNIWLGSLCNIKAKLNEYK